MMAFLFDRWANLPPHASLWTVIAAAVVIIGVVLGYVLNAALRKRQMDRMGHPPQLRRLTETSSKALAVARPILVGVALLLLVVVWFRPQSAGKARMVEARGIDLVIVLDYSKSMYARDIPRSRIERAKQELGHLLEKLSGTRVGLVLFAGTTQELPLTTDYSAIKLFWEELEPIDMPVGGTAIGLALTSATRLLQRVRGKGPDRDQVILLITDGEDHESEPLKAAEVARKLGIRVYTLGIGSPVGELIPHITTDGQQVGYVKHDGKFVTTKLDRKTLERIAQMTGGSFFHASPTSFGVSRFMKEIDKLKKAETEKRIQRTYHDVFQVPLFLALLLLVVEASLGSRRFSRRRSPRPKGPKPSVQPTEEPHA